jgi:hypothetical protein
MTRSRKPGWKEKAAMGRKKLKWIIQNEEMVGMIGCKLTLLLP